MRPTPLLVSAALLAGVFAPAALAAESQTVASFEKTITKTVGYTYLLALPTDYATTAEKTWPLLVFLHGSGERGADPWKVAVHGPPKLLRATPPAAVAAPTGAPTPGSAADVGGPSVAAPAETPEARAAREISAAGLASAFIVVSPQCPAGKSWEDDAVLALVDEIAAKHRVDPRRIYLTGLSMGGFGTWSVAMKFPERFAAIAPICGGGSATDVRRSARGEKKAALTSLGVWAFHGAKDPTVPLAESETMVAALKTAAVADVQLTVYPEAKHDSWTETYNNPALYAWLLKHQR
ncbi:MAG: hypothetical protein RLZZ15_4100 [Verrucomicrobiota bacterium]|jgi:predicted peptidase